MPGHQEVKRVQFLRRLHETQLAISFDNRCHATSQGQHKFGAREALQGNAKIRRFAPTAASCLSADLVEHLDSMIFAAEKRLGMSAAGEVLAPLFVLYDLRVAYKHLLRSESF